MPPPIISPKEDKFPKRQISTLLSSSTNSMWRQSYIPWGREWVNFECGYFQGQFRWFSGNLPRWAFCQDLHRIVRWWGVMRTWFLLFSHSLSNFKYWKLVFIYFNQTIHITSSTKSSISSAPIPYSHTAVIFFFSSVLTPYEPNIHVIASFGFMSMS